MAAIDLISPMFVVTHSNLVKYRFVSTFVPRLNTHASRQHWCIITCPFRVSASKPRILVTCADRAEAIPNLTHLVRAQLNPIKLNGLLNLICSSSCLKVIAKTIKIIPIRLVLQYKVIFLISACLKLGAKEPLLINIHANFTNFWAILEVYWLLRLVNCAGIYALIEVSGILPFLSLIKELFKVHLCFSTVSIFGELSFNCHLSIRLEQCIYTWSTIFRWI